MSQYRDRTRALEEKVRALEDQLVERGEQVERLERDVEDEKKATASAKAKADRATKAAHAAKAANTKVPARTEGLEVRPGSSGTLPDRLMHFAKGNVTGLALATFGVISLIRSRWALGIVCLTLSVVMIMLGFGNIRGRRWR